MFGKLGTGNKEWLSGSIPLEIGRLKTADVLGTFLCKPKIFRNRARKAIISRLK
jgi:hypothetical protein